MTEKNTEGKRKNSTLFRGLAVIVMLVVTTLFVTWIPNIWLATTKHTRPRYGIWQNIPVRQWKPCL